MATFFIGTGLMTFFLLLVLVVPLVRKPRHIKADAAPQASLAVYRDQFKELEDELARGAITQKEYDEGRSELERRVLEDSAPSMTLPENDSKTGTYTAFAMMIAVPLFAAFMWMVTQPLGDYRVDGGRNEGIMDYDTGRRTGGADTQSGEMHDMDQAIAKLRNYLAQNPGDLEGWLMLGRTMLTTQHYSDAAQAFERANQLAPGNPTIMVDLADAIAMVQGQELAGRPWELVQRALKIDPTNWKALAMAGTDKFNHSDYRAAVMYWERLLKVIPAGDGMADGVKASIREARELGNIVGPVQDTLDFGGKSEQSAASVPSMIKENIQPLGQSKVPAKPAQEAAPAAVEHTVGGVVEIAPELVSKLGTRNVLYITARPASGSRAPIVQMQIAVLDFPVHFRLDNTMVPPMNMGSGSLGSYEEVTVTARLGTAGSPMPRNGDIEGATEVPVKIDSDGATIVLNKEVIR